MNLTKEEIRDLASRLDALHTKSPEDYAYLKGWIHCLLYAENDMQSACADVCESLHVFLDGIRSG